MSERSLGELRSVDRIRLIEKIKRARQDLSRFAADYLQEWKYSPLDIDLVYKELFAIDLLL